MFVSDLVGHEPPEDKISSGASYTRLGRFIESVLHETLARTSL